jgi:O-antigen/teichoic acid export membrane protein
MSTLIKGTAILTLGLFLSKVLGIIYVIPFYDMVGEENIGLYQYAYIPYNLMLSLASAVQDWVVVTTNVNKHSINY